MIPHAQRHRLLRVLRLCGYLDTLISKVFQIERYSQCLPGIFCSSPFTDCAGVPSGVASCTDNASFSGFTNQQSLPNARAFKVYVPRTTLPSPLFTTTTACAGVSVDVTICVAVILLFLFLLNLNPLHKPVTPTRPINSQSSPNQLRPRYQSLLRSSITSRGRSSKVVLCRTVSIREIECFPQFHEFPESQPPSRQKKQTDSENKLSIYHQ